MDWRDEQFCRDLAATATPQKLAAEIRIDEERLEKNFLPSPLALYLPRATSSRALDIATCLAPAPGLDAEIRRLIYKSLVERLKEALNNGIRDIFEEATNSRVLEDLINESQANFEDVDTKQLVPPLSVLPDTSPRRQIDAL